MVLIRVPKPWHRSHKIVTSEYAFFNRRRFIKSVVGASIGASLAPVIGCSRSPSSEAKSEAIAGLHDLSSTTNPDFQVSDRPLTARMLAATYNNFYEFGGTKNTWQAAQALPTDDWKVEVTGLVNNPRTYDLDDLMSRFQLEERTYRFRCVEAWSMVVPWIGFPMKALLEEVDPKSQATFVRFTSFYDAKITTGPGLQSSFLPWPYTEGLRIEEMANEVAFFAVGIFGQNLPKQHGAPIRMVTPWKYGFKGAKSIVKIEFIDSQPATFWNTINDHEYKFESNVDPDVPHPRWSQRQERLIGEGPEFSVTVVPTLPYNGYGDYVASLYA